MTMKNYIEDLKSRDKKTRQMACRQLANVRSKEALRELLRVAVDDKEKDVRKEAIQAIRNLGDPEAITTLEQIANKDKDKGVRNGAKDAISIIRRNPNPIEEVSDFSSEDERRAKEDQRALDESEKGQAGLKFKIAEKLTYYQQKDGTLIDEIGEITQKIKGEGSINISNSGKEDRIWAIEGKLTDVETVEFTPSEEAPVVVEKNKLSIKELEAQDTISVPFKFELEKPKVVVYEEFVDAEDEEQPALFSRGTETSMKLKLKVVNEYDFPITEVIVKKYIEKDASTISDYVSSTGSIKEDSDEEGRFIIWTIDKIESKGSVTASCVIKVMMPEDADKPYAVGKTVTTYRALEHTVSGVGLETITGSSSVFQYISREEQEENPDNFDCEFELENTSEFEMDLKHVKIYEGSVEDENIKIEWIGDNFSEEERSIDPGEIFKLDPWVTTVEDGEVIPQFGREIDISVKYMFDAVLDAECIIPGYELPFIDIKAVKDYATDIVPSYRETPVETIASVTSEGTTEVQYVQFVDFIPEGFEAPTKDEIVVSKDDMILSPDKIEYEVGDPTEEEAKEFEGYKVMRITVPHLEETELGGLKQGEKLTCKYQIKAINPKPDTEFPSKLITYGNIYPELSTPVKAVAEDVITIKVSHLRRKIKIGKMVRSTKAVGELNEYEVILRGTNTGTAVLKNVVINDFIPKGFTLVGDTIEEPAVGSENHKSVHGGSAIKWVYEELQPEQKIEIKYKLRAEGDYDPKEVYRLLLG